MNEIRMLSTSGILGYGYAEDSLRRGMAREPHIIGADGGSTDPGPHYLGAGTSFCNRMAVKRDLKLMLQAAVAARIPCIIGTAGGAGGEPHLQDTAALVREIAREEGLSFPMALIHAEPDRATLHRMREGGRTKPLASLPELDAATIDRAERIVAMMGPEPIARALDEGAQVILCGRSSDPAQWVAPALRAGIPPAPAWYAGKMLECGAEPAVPKEPDCLLVTLRDDHLVCEPPNPIRRCTPLSVANFALHENASPIHHLEPGGMLDTEHVRFDPVSDRAVRVSGMTWTPADTYTVKLEGVERAGYRAITLCGTRDPVLIGQMDDYLVGHRERVVMKTTAIGIPGAAWQMKVRVYGQDGVMGAWERAPRNTPHELGFVVEVLADSQEIADGVLAVARTSLLHADFPGRLCREGNMAFPFSPSDIPLGPLYRFSVFHLCVPDDPYALFPIEHERV
ncbi:acyclic terpene utilization AtuA family protein [Roseococcus suduntuyensis]|uniref:Acyclic terpene utilisation N-terminal domain-containing protein n=1 Tax=Roseococcus suduntuyensis TaxID=455361 RepID=A0A840A6B3_9PROT|nr:acyclic terpene utilization AtuA family protein [Roseococcus suduntuyensis]MBB3897548.1 hypothetical protein [Roseococcus suduntuyensis]